MSFEKCYSGIFIRGALFFVFLAFLVGLPFSRAISSEEKNQNLTAGPFDLSSLWSGELVSGEPRPEIRSIAVNHKAEITQGGITVLQGQKVVFSYNPDNPLFSMGGGVLSDKNASGEWTDSLASAGNCSSGGIEYSIGSPTKAYVFKLCAIKPTVSMVPSDSGIMSCSGMSCDAVGPGAVHIEAIVSQTSLKAWGTNSGGASWDTLANVSLSSTVLSWDITIVPPPTINFSAVSQNIPYETRTVLNWNSQYADSCEASDDWSGSKDPSGSWNTGSLYGTKKYTLSCSGLGGVTSKSVTIIVGPPNPAPTLNFSASSLSVELNSSVTLSWSADHANLCLASGDWNGSKDFSGSESTGSLDRNKTYILTCSNSAGSISRILTISVKAPYFPAPTLTFSANKTIVLSGQPVKLSWSSSDASSCAASGDWSGSKAASGSENTENIFSDKNYTLSCNGAGGSISQNISVTVVFPPELNFSVDSANVPYGGTTALSWDSKMTTQCSVSDNVSWWSDLLLHGEKDTPVMTSSRNYTITCSGPGGTISRSALVTVEAPLVNPTLDFSSDSYNLPFNSSTTLSWTSQNAQFCVASGDWSGSEALFGSWNTRNLLISKTYILECFSSMGSVTKSVTITVNPPPTYDSPPTFDFWADNYNIYPGGYTILRWTTQNATFCIATGDWSGTKRLNKGSAYTDYLNSTKTYILTCGNNIGAISKSVTITVSDPNPLLAFTADAVKVVYNTATTLRWQSSNAVSCTASGDWSGAKALFGKEMTLNITENKNYQLTCTNNIGTVTKTVNIQVGDSTANGLGISFWADSFVVSPGTSTTLRWTSERTSSCAASGDWSGSKDVLLGFLSTGNLTTEKTYILTCSDSNGLSVSMEVKIGIGSQIGPSLSFWADSINVSTNSPVILHWRSQNTSSCTASGDWSGAKALSGNETILPINSLKKYDLFCSGPGGNITSYVSVAVGASSAAGPEINFWADSYKIPFGSSTFLHWTSFNTTSCFASGEWSGPLELNSSYDTGAINETKTYTLSCSGDGGQVSADISIATSRLIICPDALPLTKGGFSYLKAYFSEAGDFNCQNASIVAQDITNGDAFGSPTVWSSVDSNIVSVTNGEISGKEITTSPIKISASYKGLVADSVIDVFPPLINCWTCDKSNYSCSSQQRFLPETCHSDEYSSETDCKNECRNLNWREVSF